MNSPAPRRPGQAPESFRAMQGIVPAEGEPLPAEAPSGPLTITTKSGSVVVSLVRQASGTPIGRLEVRADRRVANTLLNSVELTEVIVALRRIAQFLPADPTTTKRFPHAHE